MKYTILLIGFFTLNLTLAETKPYFFIKIKNKNFKYQIPYTDLATALGSLSSDDKTFLKLCFSKEKEVTKEVSINPSVNLSKLIYLV